MLKKLEKKMAIGFFTVFCLLLLSLGLLISCDFLFTSYFPAYLSRVVQVKDLSAELAAAEYFEFDLAVMNNNSVNPALNDEYIFLTCHPRNAPSFLLVMDTSLNIKTKYTPSCTTPPCIGTNDLRMVNLSNDFMLGGYIVGKDGTTVTTVSPRPGYPYGIIAGAVEYELSPGLYGGEDCSSHLYYRQLGSNPSPVPMVPVENASQDCLRLKNVYYDAHQPAERRVMLFYSHNFDDGNEAMALFLPTFPPPAFMPPADSLFTDPTVIKIIKPGFDDKNTGIFYTRAGLVINHYRESKLYDLATGDELARAPLTNDYRLIMDYDLGGNYYYAFNVQEKQIYKCHTWWKK